MKKNLLRAVLAASFSLFVAGALATPSYAADAPKPPTVSKSIGKQLSDAQKAVTAKDWPTAFAKLKEAQTLEQLNAARKELGIADQFRKERTEGSMSDSRLRIACFGAAACQP